MDASTRALARAAIAFASACAIWVGSIWAGGPVRAEPAAAADGGPRRDCAAARPDAQPPAPAQTQRARAAFALDLLTGAARDGASPTVQVAPFGATQVLLALEYGAGPDMRKAIGKVLGAGGRQATGTLRADARLLNVLARETGARFATADAVFIDRALTLKPGLAEAIEAETATQLRTVDFADPASIAAVDDWAREATGGRIATILEPGERLSLAALNAFSFVDCWKHPFDPAKTIPIRFRRADGREDAVPAMTSAEVQLPFAHQGDWLAVELPYADERFALTLVTNTTTPLTRASLKEALAIASASMQPTSVILQVPRFRATGGADLLATLGELGLGSHRRLPNFGADVVLSAVRQKTLVIVDERGTEVAAVTAGIASRSASLAPVRLTFAQPFVFLLRHRPTGTVLLAGLYQHPDAAAGAPHGDRERSP